MITFGTGGWRAIIGDTFIKSNIQLLAAALADKMKAEGVEPTIVLGYDRRFLSKESMQWAAMTLAAKGIRTLLINRSCPTPTVMYYVRQHKLAYGMMITASHNPAIYNGIKVFTAGGRDADKTTTDDIERYASRIVEAGTVVPEMQYDDGKAAGLIEEIYPINEYIDRIIDSVDIQAIRNASLRVAIDPMFGVSETSIKTVLITARCEVETIHARHDTLFGGKLPAPNREAMQELSNYVVRYNYDIGIATDGDADRIGVIDDKGRYLTPNDVMAVLYCYLHRYKHLTGGVVRNLCTTELLDRIAAAFGEECYEVPVGFKYISSKMEETNALIGGESSGGLTVRGHIRGKDGVYAAALLVELLAVTGMKMSEFVDSIHAEFGNSFLAEHNYGFRPERKTELLEKLGDEQQISAMLKDFDPADYEISRLDGVKISFKKGGWISMRFSGTEPLLRIFTEMEKEEDAEALAETCRQYLMLT